ncbi:hypothetical protein LINGRAPRIM_LOCUS573 [Linum grandiflorum]
MMTEAWHHKINNAKRIICCNYLNIFTLTLRWELNQTNLNFKRSLYYQIPSNIQMLVQISCAKAFKIGKDLSHKSEKEKATRFCIDDEDVLVHENWREREKDGGQPPSKRQHSNLTMVEAASLKWLQKIK